MLRVVALLLLIVVVLPAGSALGATSSEAGPQTRDSRIAAPSESAIAASRKLIREVYPEDLSRQTPPEKRALAGKMLDAALQTTDNPADRYVMLQEAMELAAGAGDAQIINKAADALAAGYLCNAAAQRAEALAKCYAVAPSPAIAAQVAAAEIAAAEQSADNDDFDAASKYSEKGIAAARTSEDRALIAWVQSRAAALRETRAQFGQVRSAFAKLKSDPNDPASNLAVGQYLCFNRGNWKEGLPHLARGSDAALKQLAETEMTAAADSAAQADLAERWWNLAEQDPKLPAKAIRAHAAELYRKALRDLAGLAKAVAQKRIDQVASEQTPGATMPQLPAIANKSNPPGSRELLGDMIGGVRQADGILVLSQVPRATTKEKFRPPVAFHIVAQTDSTNVRLVYAARQIIFDWEVRPSELRVDGGPANGQHKKGAGLIEPGTWADIDLIVLPDSMTIAVNGQERYHVSADFSDVNQPFGIFTTDNATVQVKSLTVRTP